MRKRLISATKNDLVNISKEELKKSIEASEGRVIMTETIVCFESLLRTISNAEVAKAFGSDMILLNFFDVLNPKINGIDTKENPVNEIKELTGLPVGCNLEAVDFNATMLEDRITINKGRQANKESFIAANDLGLDYICITGNPGVGVSNQAITNAIKLAKENYNGLIIAGKMHGAGIKEEILDLNVIKNFIDAGADIILLPALNTVPGISEVKLTEAVKFIHDNNCLALAAIGTSQESSDENTIREIALSNKRCGFDISHIGDAGYCGMAIPENIMALSIAIKGKRHTYFRMAASIKR